MFPIPAEAVSPIAKEWLAFLRLAGGSLALVLCLTSCAGHEAFRKGQAAMADGRLEDGVSQLKSATEAAPNNMEFKRS